MCVMFGMSRPRAAISVATRMSASPSRICCTDRLLSACDMPPWQITTPRNFSLRNLNTSETVSRRLQKTMIVALRNSRLERMPRSRPSRSLATGSVFSLRSDSSDLFIILCSMRSPCVNITRQREPISNSTIPRLPWLVMTSLPASNCLRALCGGRASMRTCWMVFGTGFVLPPVQSTQTHLLPRKASISSRTEVGMVADQKDVWRPPVAAVAMPPCSMISSSWLPKPSSIMRSTSSKTRCLTWSSWTTPRCNASTSLPGVATRMSAPCARSRS
mmetsp:Transcript_54342/g.145482  ORF Transcript_54342/g.145482 Transcript_54342/m.145482 type:complete len:274 (-) Transcript_54342:72-893(-)